MRTRNCRPDAAKRHPFSCHGDRVQTEMTYYDLEKGRVIYRERTPGSGFSTPRGVRPR